jgi:hypothetical protein
MYLEEVEQLQERWRSMLAASGNAQRADAAVWAVLDILPAHPILTAPAAAAATQRSRPSIYQALEALQKAGVLIPLSQAARNQTWEAAGLVDLMARMEAGEVV